MIMKRLISMVDFVLEKDSTCIYKYAKFLKQPLELGFFIPTNENGDVLQEPNRSTHTDIECEQYKQAKERCLFEGFENMPGGWARSKNIEIDDEFCQNRTIEDIVKYNLELTQTAIKQLGL